MQSRRDSFDSAADVRVLRFVFVSDSASFSCSGPASRCASYTRYVYYANLAIYQVAVNSNTSVNRYW